MNHEKRKLFKIAKSLRDDGFPTHAKKYRSAHEHADKEEKRKFGSKSYDKLKKFDRKLSKHELAGKNSKSGRIEVSSKVPKSLRKEVAYHERVENKQLRKSSSRKDSGKRSH